MKKSNLLFLLLLLFPNTLNAQQYKGVAAFAALNPNYPCDALLNTLSNVHYPATSILWENFGNDPSCVSRFLNKFKDRPHVLQLHFTNEACRRKNTCFDNLFLGSSVNAYNKKLEAIAPETEDAIQARVSQIVNFLEPLRNPNTKIILSTGLEDNLSLWGYRNLARVMKQNWPFELNRNRHTGGRSLFYVDYEEFHSAKGKPRNKACIANEDGNSHTSKQSKKFFKRYARCSVLLLWRGRHQGRIGNWKNLNPKNSFFYYPQSDVKLLSDVLN